MPYYLLAISIAFGLAGNAFQNAYCKRYIQKPSDHVGFNLALAASAALTLLALNRGFAPPSSATFLLGIAFGAVVALALLSTSAALSLGPMTFTVMISSCAMLIPTFCGTLLWHENVRWWQAVGVLLLVAALYWGLDPKRDRRLTLRWGLACVVMFLANGSIGVMQKVHQSSAGREEQGEFLVVAFLTAVVLLGAVRLGLLLRRTVPGGAAVPAAGRFSCRPFLLTLGAGVCMGAIHSLNLRLSGLLPSILFFPVFNGSVILLSAIAARFLFRERMARGQVIGLLLGVLAISLIGMSGGSAA